MTDTEMVKVMEVCKDKEMPCDDCPLVEYGDCEEISRQYFYDRFKQLKAENAALRDKLEKVRRETAQQVYGKICAIIVEASTDSEFIGGDGYDYLAAGLREIAAEYGVEVKK